MHPTKKELELYAADLLIDAKQREIVGNHIEICEFCREYLENCDLMHKSLDDMAQWELAVKALALADKLYNQALSGQVVQLETLGTEKPEEPLLMAADGGEKFAPDTVNLATYYSENPELILRIMRDKRKNQDYLQLIGDSPTVVSNVLVQVPEIKLEVFTDSEGMATLADVDTGKLQSYTWQVKMPDAVFDLEPMQYDPEKTEYSKEIVLETEKDDQIQVMFEGKTEGKQISIRIIKLEGKTEFEDIRVHIAQEGKSVMKRADKTGRISFDLKDFKSRINIRLYT